MPDHLVDMADILHRLGSDARQVRMLFVTVDPNRDTLPVLTAYVKNFAPQIEGLHGTGTARDVGAALSCGLFGDPGEQGPPLRGDP